MLFLPSAGHPSRSTLFPYTTLFRSHSREGPGPKPSLRRRPPRKLPEPCQPSIRNALTRAQEDRKSTRLNSSHTVISYAVFCLKKKKEQSMDTVPLATELRDRS